MVGAFKKKLKHLMRQRGTTPRQLSIDIGRDPSYISKILKGTIIPSYQTFEKICHILEVQAIFFFDPANNDPAVLGMLYYRMKDWPEENLYGLYNLLCLMEPKK